MMNFIPKQILLLFLCLSFSNGTNLIESLQTWSWVAIYPSTDRVAEWISPFNRQEIDINQLHVFSNISELQSDVEVLMSFRNPHQLQLYKHFTVIMADVSQIKSFKIERMGTSIWGQKVHKARAERLVQRFRNGGSPCSGVVMTRTSPYLREFDVHVFLESQTSMTFDLYYKEKLQSLLSANWYEQQIRIYPYQLVEDFQIDVVINPPRTGTLSVVDAYWDIFSASNTIADPWGLQREPLTVRPWNGGSRINVSPIRSDLTSPRSWQSDLIVIFEWDSPNFGFEGTSWSSYIDFVVPSEMSDSYDYSIDVTDPVVTLTPRITDLVLTTSAENPAEDSSETSSGEAPVVTSGSDDYISFSGDGGSGEDETTDFPTGSEDTASQKYTEQSGTSTHADVDVSLTVTDYFSSEISESDFVFTVESSPTINVEKFDGKKQSYFKVYQKETSLEFNIPSSKINSNFISTFKRMMKRLFTKKTETSQERHRKSEVTQPCNVNLL